MEDYNDYDSTKDTTAPTVYVATRATMVQNSTKDNDRGYERYDGTNGMMTTE